MSSGIPEPSIWDFVGEDGLPKHLPMRINDRGEGPLDDSERGGRWVCWCGDRGCSWTMAFANERSITREMTLRDIHRAIRGFLKDCQRRSWPVTASGLMRHLEDLKL